MTLNLASTSNKLINRKWLVNGAYHETMCKLFSSFVESGADITKLLFENGKEYNPEKLSNVDPLYTIPIIGVLSKSPSMVETMLFGAVDVDAISEQLDYAVKNDSVKEILLWFASPGGESTGIEELGRKIKNINDNVKPIYAWTEASSGMNSAAYWLGSQAGIIGMSPSSNVGSVGVYSLLLKERKALEAAGIVVEDFVAGKYKAMGASWKDLSDEERTILREDVEAHREKFRNTVSTSRPQIKREDMEGLSFEGNEALNKGYVNIVTDTLDEFLTKVNQTKQTISNMKNNVQIKAEEAKVIKEVTQTKVEETLEQPTETLKVIQEAITKLAGDVKVVPGVNASDEDEGMCSCTYCGGTGKMKADDDTDDDDDNDNDVTCASEPVIKETATEPVLKEEVKEETLTLPTAGDFHKLFGGQYVPQNAQTEFSKAMYKMVGETLMKDV